MEKQLIEEISDGVATLTFNRPARLNAPSTPIMEACSKRCPRSVTSTHGIGGRSAKGGSMIRRLAARVAVSLPRFT